MHIKSYKMKKILFFVQMPPPVHGAALSNRKVVNSKSLQSKFLTRLNAINFSRSLEEMQSKSALKFFKIFVIVFRLVKDLIFFRPDVVYFSISPVGSSFLRDVLFVLIIKIFRVKLLYHLHGKGIADIKSKPLLFIYRFVFRNSTVICLSEGLSKDIDHVKSNAVVEICPNGVSDSFYSKRDKVINVTFLSNLLPLKGVYVFLDAMTLLLESGCDVEVNLAGPFNKKFSEQDLELYLSRSSRLKSKIKVYGMVNEAQKKELLAKTDILTHPTMNDAQPLVLIEAMAAGCFIISTRQGGIPDILDGQCFASLIDQADPKLVYEEVVEVIRDSDILERASKVAIDVFKDNYSDYVFENRMVSIFESVLENDKRN